MKILHIITGLNQGGAEGALFRLVTATAGDVSHSVVSLLDDGRYGRRLAEHGVPVHTLDMPRGMVTWRGIIRLRSLVKAERPDLVQTWMYHADLLGGLVTRSVGRAPVVWGIRHSTLDPQLSKLRTRLVVQACIRLSRIIPTCAISCSSSAAEVHRELGYRTPIAVVPNGFDLGELQPDRFSRERIRNDLGLPFAAHVLGYVARWDPQKDHETLFSALALLRSRGLRPLILLVGTQMDGGNQELGALLTRFDLRDQVRLLGPRSDVSSIMNAIDVHVMSSAYGEAFPNVLAEAMACGVPCVATDVGDSRAIVSDAGWVVPPRQPAQFADALREAVLEIGSQRFESRRSACRRFIERHYGMDVMAAGFLRVWDDGISRGRH